MFPSSSSSSEISELCHNKTFFMKYLHSLGTLSKQDAKDGVDGSSSQWSEDDCLIGYRPFRRSPSLFSDSNRDGRSVMFSENNPDLRAACFSRGQDMADRGTKRKMMEPVPSCNMVKKKRMFTGASRISGFIGPNSSKETCDDEDKECMHEKKTRAREKRRRRREKNHEKYGDKHRWAFTCAFCKFHTFEDKDIEKHFGSSNHRETLDHIRRQAKFDDKVISFLHDCMVHKFRKTVSALHKLKTSCVRSKDRCAPIMEGVMEEDYMRRVEVVHCVACDIYIPVVYSSVQQHLHSLNHLRRKVIYKDQLQKESVVTAKAIINNDNVKVCYEKYIKGEDPFAVDTKYRSFDCQEPEEEDVEKYSKNIDIN